MEKITYQKLKEGYFLRDEDVLDTLHGFDNLVVTGLSMCNKCWLHNPDGTNSALYEHLGIADPKLECAAPDFDSAEELTKHVISLFERSPYKVGDKVRILKRKKARHDYPFSFVEEMEELAGETFTIKRIELNTICGRDKYNGDFHRYHLDGPGDWSWHSSMFEKADSDSEIKKESAPEKKYKYEDGQRLTICGKTYCVHRNRDNNFLVCDGYPNRQVFIDLGIIKIGEDYKLNKWIEDHGFKHSDGSFPPIISDQFDDFIDLLLQMEKDQGTVYQCQTSEKSYKLKDKIKLGKCNYEISKNDRGYYLSNIDDCFYNDKMFKELEVNTREWLKSHGFDYNDYGIFPEQKTLEKLNQVIKALQKEFVSHEMGKKLEDAILAAAKPVSRGPEIVWLPIDTSTSPEKLKFAKKKKNIHITL